METVNLNIVANEKLSLRERDLWSYMRTGAGVLFCVGIPGVSKSATFANIAKKMGMQYIDLRLSTMDETDLGLFPQPARVNGVPVVEYCVPMWAVKANECPTLIHFEELNRAPQNLRNAALGILNEKRIGGSYQLNNNVYMVASGNPPADYDCDVEELGNALLGRLITKKFSMTLRQWIDEYAEENIIPEVVSFLNQKPDFFGNTKEQQEKFISDTSIDDGCGYPSPRSWTFLSEHIKAFGDDSQRRDVLTSIDRIKSFVGELPATSFVNYINETFKINVDDVLEGKKDISNIDNMSVQRIVSEFQDTKVLHKLDNKKLENWKNFIAIIMSDEILAGHISSIVSECDLNTLSKKEIQIYRDFFKPHKKITDIIMNSID